MKKTTSSFIRGADPKVILEIGKIRIVKAWLDHYGIPYDEKSVTTGKGDSGEAIIELNVDNDINATILNGNPDWKSGRTGTAKISFEFKD